VTRPLKRDADLFIMLAIIITVFAGGLALSFALRTRTPPPAEVEAESK